jgi:hypothetical protein
MKKATGIELIAEERARQISQENWSEAHDDTHTDGDMRDAAEAYLRELRYRFDHRDGVVAKIPSAPWPWLDDSWKPTANPIRQLVKAGALIAAEIDRLARKPGAGAKGEG